MDLKNLQNGNFNFSFSMLVKRNPALKYRLGNILFDKQPVENVGEMNLVKVGTIIIASFFLDDFGKDVVIFDISKKIGNNINFAFNFKNGKVEQVFVSNKNSCEDIEVKFTRCPK